jgi:hypothetical protein
MSARTIQTDEIKGLNGGVLVRNKLSYADIPSTDDLVGADIPSWQNVLENLTSYAAIEVPVTVGTQLVDYGQGYTYRIPNTYEAVSVAVAVNGMVNFVPYKVTTDNIDVYLPDYDGSGLTTQPYVIMLNTSSMGAIISGEDKVLYKAVATYAEMEAEGNPIHMTIYKVTTDENKNYTRSTYNWWPDGNREWVASTPDN